METRYSQIISILLIALGIIAAIFIEPSFFKIDKEWKDFSLGLDLQGGVELLYKIDLSEIEKADHTSAVSDLRDVIEKRINVLGVKEPEIESVLTSEGYRLKVRIPGVTDPNEAVKQIGRTPFLEFQKPKSNYLDIIENELSESPFEPTELTGRYLTKASAVTNNTAIEYFVELEFDDTGKELFAQLTEEFVRKPIAILIDGELISWPTVQEKITDGNAVINGKFGPQEAK